MTCGVCHSKPAAYQVIAVDSSDGIHLGDPYWLPVCNDCDAEAMTITIRPLRTTPLDRVAITLGNRPE